MDFKSFKKSESVSELKIELKVLESSINEDMPAGDKKVIEKKIAQLQEKIKLFDSTVAGDIAIATTDFSLCSGEDGCECGKCQILKRPELREAVEKNSAFGGFFGG